MTLRTYVVGSNLLEFRDLRKARDSEKLKARDQALLEAVYDELFTPNFPDPDEQETLADWTPRLWGNPTQERPRQSELHGFVAGTHLDDPKARSLAGFAFVERYPESRCALLSYIAVDPHARGKGIARKLFSKARGSAERAARDEGHPLGAVFAEIHDPHRVTDDVIDASDRVRIMAKLGARLVPIRYVQPALGKHGERSDRLMLIAFPMDGEHSLDGSVICGFLREYYATLGLPAHDADLKDAEQALGKGSVELAPLGTSLDFEEFGVALHFVAKPRKKPKRLEILKRDLVALLRQRSLASARAVTINGIPTVGTKTTLTAGTYEAPPTGRSYQWQFCEPGYAHCADIPDATHPTYTPVDDDKGRQLRVVETVTRLGYENGHSSSASAAVGQPNPFTSFEADLLTYRYVPDRETTGSAAVFSSKTVEVPADLEVVTLSLPGTIEYVSEGRRAPLHLPEVGADRRRRRRLAVKASRTDFHNSDLSVLHLVLTHIDSPSTTPGFDPSEFVLDEFDIVALSKLWQGGEEWPAADEILFHPGMEGLGTGLPVGKLAEKIFDLELKDDDACRVRLGTVQLITNGSTRCGAKWTEIWDDIEALCRVDKPETPKHEQRHHGAVRSLGGVVQGILDFHKVDFSELEDVFAGPEVHADLVGMHKGTVLCVIESDRSYKASATTIGISPYLLLPQAVLLHNEAVLDEGERLVGTSKRRERPKQLEDLTIEIRQLLASYLPNVFHYPQEHELYETGEKTRDLGFRRTHLKERLGDLEARWEKAVAEKRSLAEDLRNSLLLVLALLPIYPFLSYWHQREAFGLVVLVAALLLVVPRLNSRRRDSKRSE